jgi:hypothetical protein
MNNYPDGASADDHDHEDWREHDFVVDGFEDCGLFEEFTISECGTTKNMHMIMKWLLEYKAIDEDYEAWLREKYRGEI